MIAALVFYLFAALAVAAGAMVVVSKNPVHSVLFLILAFFNVAGLFVLLGAEFLAMIMVVVYVGAVAVLFLFVVMMLDLRAAGLREGVVRHAPAGIAVALVLFAELVLVFGGWVAPADLEVVRGAAMPDAAEVGNTLALGRILYTDYVYPFQLAGIVLLVAMVGAIVLTVRRKAEVRRQDAAGQAARRPEDCIEVRKVAIGKGI